MYRIDSANTAAVLPTPSALGTERYFEDHPLVGGSGSTLEADWLNMVMLSILDVLDDQSISHSKTDYTQLTDAITAKISDEAPPEDTATASAPGLVQLATDAEVLAMALTTRVIAPSSFGAAIMGAGSGIDGFGTLSGDPSYDRWVVQAVTTYRASSGDQWVYWPVSFASSTYTIILGGNSTNLTVSLRSQERANVTWGSAGYVSAIAFGPRYI